MALKQHCDICGEIITEENTARIDIDLPYALILDAKVKLLEPDADKPLADVCLYCLIRALNFKDKRPRQGVSHDTRS